MEDAKQIEDMIFGRNPVKEALNSEREINKILLGKGKNDGSIKAILGLAKSKNIIIQQVEVQKLDKITDGQAHQGIIAYVSPYEYVDVEDIIEIGRNKDSDPFIIICDEISDPHNLGAIIRTANAVGADGVIIPKRRSATLSSTVVKTSAGAAEYVPVARVGNLSQTIEKLKKEGLWIGCADMDGDPYYDCNLTGPIGIVIGSEGKGVGRLIKEKCDFVVSMPMVGQVNSLNASVAGSIFMYDVVRQRNAKKR